MNQKIKVKWPESLVIVRHGQSEQNIALDLLQDNLAHTIGELANTRDADIKLTKVGIWQAEQTGKFLAKMPKFDICFSSPYKRAQQTAEAIVAQLPYDTKIYKDNRLREKEFGRLHGFTKLGIKEQYPEEYADRQREGKYWYRLPRGENYPDVEMRIHSFLDKLVRDWEGKRVLVITHQVPCIMFRSLFEHLDEGTVLALGDVANCGVQEYVLDISKYPEGRMKLRFFNHVVYDMNYAPKQ